jgi:hypothetical protein
VIEGDGDVADAHDMLLSRGNVLNLLQRSVSALPIETDQERPVAGAGA